MELQNYINNNLDNYVSEFKNKGLIVKNFNKDNLILVKYKFNEVLSEDWMKYCKGCIIDKLTKNGFHIKYTYPNLLFISWKHYIPDYKRLEYKKKTGKIIDGFGNIKVENSKAIISIKKKQENKSNISFKKINTYQPTGSLIYNTNLLKKIKEKIT